MKEPHAIRPPYGLVFLSLVLLTVAEVWVFNLPLTKALVILALVSLAISKASLVALYYMHLRFERLYIALIGFGPLVLSIILVVSLLFDRPISF